MTDSGLAGGLPNFVLHDFEPPTDRLCDDAAAGLSAAAKRIPPKYFYDGRGAELFERITTLPEYYPTWTELGILRDSAGEIAAALGPGVRLVEFGSGSGEKTWVLLSHLEQPAAYIPVDISRAQLIGFAREVAAAYPSLHVVAVCTDYAAGFELPPDPDGARRTVAYFPGSTIGNFEPEAALDFLRQVRKLVGPSGGMVLGVDLWKDPEILHHAYNDQAGVTAEFNLNLLRRINRECGANFDLSAFRHEAVVDPEERRVEMRLVSRQAQEVRIPSTSDPADGDAPRVISFDEGEHIVTEYSHKYHPTDFAEFVAQAGWRVVRRWTDERGWFAVVLLE